MRSITINSYEELIEKITEANQIKISSFFDEAPKGYFYRGQANKEWRLVPSLISGKNASEDKELLDLLNSSKNQPKKVSLAVAQHYGKKTRCLDFTRNYKIALYFACNPNDVAYDKDGAVFVFGTTYHLPNWFTNYLVYYTAIDTRPTVSAWEYARFISQKEEIIAEFTRTGRSLDISDVESEIQIYLGKGFMVDFANNDYGFERIKKQEAALYYFGSKYYSVVDGEKHYIDIKYLSTQWSSQDCFNIELHNLSNHNLEDNAYCTKIIIPQRLKREILDKIDIKASDLGL